MLKRELGDLDGESIVLRPLSERDLALTLRWRNEARVREQFFTSRPLSQDEHEGWYRRYKEREDDYVFLIVDRGPPERPVGQLALYDIDGDSKSAQLGRLMIGEEDMLGRGFAKAACARILAFAFREVGLHLVHLNVRADNQRAVGLYRSLGFSEVSRGSGRMRMELRRTIMTRSP